MPAERSNHYHIVRSNSGLRLGFTLTTRCGGRGGEHGLQTGDVRDLLREERNLLLERRQVMRLRHVVRRRREQCRQRAPVSRTVVSGAFAW